MALTLVLMAGCKPSAQHFTESSGIAHLSAYKDTSGQLTAKDAWNAPFEAMTGTIFDEGFSAAAYWLRLRMPADQAGEPQFIVFESLTLDRAEIYSARMPVEPAGRAGDRIGRSSWAVPWSDYATFPVQSGETYLIRIQSTSLLMMPVTIRSESNLREFTERRTYISALYAGFIVMFCLVALVVFLALRDIVYLLYVGYIATQTLAFAALFSSFYRLLWPESPYIQNHLYFLAQALSLGFGTAFFRVFMDLAERRPRLNIVVTSVSVLSFLIAIGTLFSDQNVWFSRSLTVIYLLWIPTFLVMTMRQIQPGRFDMWIFALVWGAVYVAGILYMLSAARIIPYHPLFFYGPTAFFPFDAAFFVLSLYQRYRNLEMERAQLEREMQSTLAKLTSLSRNQRGLTVGTKTRSKLAGLDVKKTLVSLDEALRMQKMFKREDVSLTELAGHIGVSPHQLSELCNTQLNTSFPKLLSYHRVLEAKELMANSDLNILQIAFESGFASKSAFNTEFKRVTGMTPREYRARPDLRKNPDLPVLEAS